MKVLVTGGAGFIGSNFIHYLLETYPDYRVINYDKLTYAGNIANCADLTGNDRYRFVRGDIGDYSLVSDVVAGVDAVVNFAAESHVDRSIVEPTPFIQTNVLGTAVLLRVAKEQGISRFHQISTDEVYGHLGATGFFSEQTPYQPRSPYAASKASADHIVRSFFHTYKLPVTISNCCNNFGPRQFPEKIMPLFITNLMQNKKVPLYGQGENVRDWLYVDDHSRAVDKILHAGRIGETYCIGAHNEYTNKQIALRLLECFNLGEEMIDYVTDRPGHDFRYAIDYSKINRELGWQPQESFDDALQSTVRWYRDNQHWWQDILSGKYLEYNKSL